MSDIIRNPLNYTGSKDRILPLIKENLPQDRLVLYDLFGGSGVVSVNLDFDMCFYNEKNKYIYGIMRTFREMGITEILQYIDQTIKVYDLGKNNKEQFLIFRDKFNKIDVPYLSNEFINDYLTHCAYLDLYVLMCHSYNYMLQTNSKGEFNVPSGCGRSWFNPTLRQKLVDFKKAMDDKHLLLFNLDYHDVPTPDNLNGALFFVDPPYSCSDDVYSRNPDTKWSKQNDLQLFDYLDDINSRGGKFMLTNTVVCNGKVNEELQEWCQKYRTVEVTEQFYNCNHQRKNGKTREIILVNY